METNSVLVPLLVVHGADRAIDFYVRALGPRVVARYEHGPERRISHADLMIGEVGFAVTEEARGWNSDAPPSLGGSPVVIQLFVSDAEQVLAAMCAAGASVVFELQEFLGERMARLRDPFGHLWLLRQTVLELSTQEQQRERDAWLANPKDPTRLSEVGPTQQVRNQGSENASSAGSLAAREPPPPGAGRGRVHLLLGPVGAGKSTCGIALANERRALRLTLDEWMSQLFSPDRPESGLIEWYVERAERCIERIWGVARQALELGTDVVLEIGLLRRCERERFYRSVQAGGFELQIYVIDAPRDVRRERVAERNLRQGPTFSMLVPPHIFELASDLWEPPDAAECAEQRVRFMLTDAAGRGEGRGTLAGS